MQLRRPDAGAGDAAFSGRQDLSQAAMPGLRHGRHWRGRGEIQSDRQTAAAAGSIAATPRPASHA